MWDLIFFLGFGSRFREREKGVFFCGVFCVCFLVVICRKPWEITNEVSTSQFTSFLLTGVSRWLEFPHGLPGCRISQTLTQFTHSCLSLPSPELWTLLSFSFGSTWNNYSDFFHLMHRIIYFSPKLSALPIFKIIINYYGFLLNKGPSVWGFQLLTTKELVEALTL